MNIIENTIYKKYESMKESEFNEEILNFITKNIISKDFQNLCSFSEYSLIKNYLKLNFYEFISITDLSVYFSSLDEFQSFIIKYTNKEYLNSYMCRQSLENIIKKSLIDDEKEKRRLLGITSISSLLGISYPDNTCPMIDKDLNYLKEEKEDYLSQIDVFEDEISEIESTLDDPTCYFNEEIEKLQDKISDLQEKVTEIEEDEFNAEALRSSCEDIRDNIINANEDYKNEIQLFKVNEKYIFSIPQDDFSLKDNIEKSLEEPSFSLCDFSDSIINLYDLFDMGIQVSQALKLGLKKEIESLSIIEYNEFINDYIKNIISEFQIKS